MIAGRGDPLFKQYTINHQISEKCFCDIFNLIEIFINLIFNNNLYQSQQVKDWYQFKRRTSREIWFFLVGILPRVPWESISWLLLEDFSLELYFVIFNIVYVLCPIEDRDDNWWSRGTIRTHENTETPFFSFTFCRYLIQQFFLREFLFASYCKICEALKQVTQFRCFAGLFNKEL